MYVFKKLREKIPSNKLKTQHAIYQPVILYICICSNAEEPILCNQNGMEVPIHH